MLTKVTTENERPNVVEPLINYTAQHTQLRAESVNSKGEEPKRA